MRNGLAKASVGDTLAFLADVALPTFGKGVVIRRPKIVSLAERLGLDDWAVKRLQRLRAKYGAGPLLLAIPGRSQAVILSPEHVHRVLEGTPEPFATASSEKRAALAHFEPKVSLVSHGPERAERRRSNEAVLESGCPVHSMADAFMAVVGQEARTLLSDAGEELDWDAFTIAWHRVVRRVVLGEGARDDDGLTDMLARLRAAGNWAFLHPRRKALLRRFHDRVKDHLDRAEPGSLAGLVAATRKTDDTAPSHQVAHWLFAFDAGGMATFRALALLASHPPEAQRACAEIAAAGAAGRKDLPFVRACVLDALRLWPTTPAIFRETTTQTRWDGGVMPKNTGILIFAPFFHRDDERLPHAHRFAPDLWLEADPGRGWPLIPFSRGPGICPGRDLVSMLASAMIAAILEAREIELRPPARLDPARPLPGTLDHHTLRFGLRASERPGRPRREAVFAAERSA